MKRVLVIGGAGYLGSVLCNKLVDQLYYVKCYDNLIYGDRGLVNLYNNDRFMLVKGDIRDIDKLDGAMEGIDCVINLAAIVGDEACNIHRSTTRSVNYEANKDIITLCKKHRIKKFIFASTCSVYGQNLTDQLLTECSPLNPVSLYAETKISAEKYIMESINDKFTPIILRMGTLYGLSDRMRFDLAVNIMSIKAIFEKEFTVFGGDQYRPFLHIDDAADAYISCMESNTIYPGIYNIVGTNLKIEDLGHIIKEETSAKMNIDTTNVDKRNYSVSMANLYKQIGISPSSTIEQFIIDLHDYVYNGMYKDYKSDKYSNAKWLKKHDL